MMKSECTDTRQGAAKLSRTVMLLRRLQSALQGSNRNAPTYLEMHEWTGVAEATLKDWFNGRGKPSAEFMMHLLERLPSEARARIIDDGCRSFPTLEHQRLKYDATVTSQLKTITGQKTGLSIIQGGTDESRTFLATALARFFLLRVERPNSLHGIDIHEPDWFVPVPGVHYLHNEFQPLRLRECVIRLWPTVINSTAQTILLNGIWSRLPELHKAIKEQTKRKHFIVSDPGPIKLSRRRSLAAPPANLISISEPPSKAPVIFIQVLSL